MSEVVVDEAGVTLDGDDTRNENGKIPQPFAPSQVRVETRNTQMDSVIKRMKYGEIELNPEFQRRPDVWRDDRQSRLIESMLIRIPLPAFYIDATDDNNWVVVDGLQRLNAVRRFVVDEELELKGLEFMDKLEGKKFSELPRIYQRRIEETDIVIHKIQKGTPEDVKYIIFRRINTGGEPLSSQEIRHALNQGDFTRYLGELAESEEFRTATDNGVSPRRMDDQECVLRFMAFTMTQPSKYSEDDFDLFLNTAMKEGNKLSDEEMKQYGMKFLRAMNVSREIFGSNAFRKFYRGHYGRFPVNKALFEAVSVNIGALDEAEQDMLIKKRELVIDSLGRIIAEDKEFDSSISQGTGSVKKVQYRFNAVKNIFVEVMDYA